MEAVPGCTLWEEASDPSAAYHKILTPWPEPNQCLFHTQTLSNMATNGICNGAHSQINTLMPITLTK